MSRRDPQEIQLTEEVLDSLNPVDARVLEQLDSLSIDDGGESITIDSDDGPIAVQGSFTQDLGDTVFNTQTSVAPNVSSTIVSYTPSSDEAVTGFTGNGESDGRWTLYIDGKEKASSWTNQANPNAKTDFDNPIELPAGVTVRLEIENIGLDTADYDGTIFIRV